jgi:hypothetical protein
MGTKQKGTTRRGRKVSQYWAARNAAANQAAVDQLAPLDAVDAAGGKQQPRIRKERQKAITRESARSQAPTPFKPRPNPDQELPMRALRS